MPDDDEVDPEPTDYSKRYAERAGDDYVVAQSGKNETASEDTVKVYHTEDTPLNFSLASSLTDLHHLSLVDGVDGGHPHSSSTGQLFGGYLTTKTTATVAGNNKTVLPLVGSNGVAVEGIIKKPQLPKKPRSLIRNSVPSETTAVVVSHQRSNSLSDGRVNNLNATNNNQVNYSSTTKQNGGVEKSVTFGDGVNFAEETPLMFSRCSSLGSLSSFDFKSLNDDRSSVVSDFSRRASEVVSPSDLPDSPGQTFPSSPQNEKASEEYANNNEKKPEERKEIPCDNVFEEHMKNYAVEGTPANFSRSTSLSSLDLADDGNHCDRKNGTSKVINDIEEKKSNSPPLVNNAANGDLDDAEKLLADCISVGVKSVIATANHVRKSSKPNNLSFKMPPPRHPPPPLPPKPLVLTKYSSLQKRTASDRCAFVPRTVDNSLPMKVFQGPKNALSLENNVPVNENNVEESKESKAESNTAQKENRPKFTNGANILLDEEQELLNSCIERGIDKQTSSRYYRSKATNHSEWTKEDEVKLLNSEVCKQTLRPEPDERCTSPEIQSDAAPQTSPNEAEICWRNIVRKCTSRDDRKESQSATNNSSMETSARSDVKSSSASSVSSSRAKVYAVEDTPISFSRQSSLRSLSVNSSDSTTLDEELLLLECINSGMPKPKPRAAFWRTPGHKYEPKNRQYRN